MVAGAMGGSMDDQKAQEAARKAQEAARRGQERTQEAANESSRIVNQLTEAGAQATAVWSDVNQRVGRDVMDLSATAMRDGAQMMLDLQQVQFDLMREMQGNMWRWWTVWPTMFGEGLRWYQRATEESVEATQRAFRIGRRNVDVFGQAVDRMQASAEEAARTLGGTFRQAASRMQEVQGRMERIRAA
jgi:hypothetical protein